MNNNSFIQELSASTGYTAEATQKLVDTMADIFRKNFLKGNQINISTFGFFEVVKQSEKIVLDASTGVKTMYPPKLELNFKASKTIRK